MVGHRCLATPIRDKISAKIYRQRIPPKNVFYYRCPDHQKNYILSFAFAFDREDDVYQVGFYYLRIIIFISTTGVIKTNTHALNVHELSNLKFICLLFLLLLLCSLPTATPIPTLTFNSTLKEWSN